MQLGYIKISSQNVFKDNMKFEMWCKLLYDGNEKSNIPTNSSVILLYTLLNIVRLKIKQCEKYLLKEFI